MQDPRFKNELPQAKDVGEYLDAYAKALSTALTQVDKKELQRAENALLKCIEKGHRVYVAGNGGSAAIGDHLCCDWMKGTHVHGKSSLKVHPLASAMGLMTALANDFGYEKTFSTQIEMMAETGDIAVLISSSGNSPNILAAAEMCKKRGVTIIGMTGFTGGKLKEMSDISLYVPINNYGLAEDAHQSIMHILTHVLNKKRDT